MTWHVEEPRGVWTKPGPGLGWVSREVRESEDMVPFSAQGWVWILESTKENVVRWWNKSRVVSIFWEMWW